MIRRVFGLMAGAALAVALIGPHPAAAQGKKIVLAIPGHSADLFGHHCLCRRETGLLQKVRRRRHDPPV